MGLLQLEDASITSTTITEVVQRTKLILKEIEDKPDEVVSVLLKKIDKTKLTKIMTGTLGSGTRVSARSRFITENVMSDISNSLEAHSYKLKLAKEVMTFSVQYALMTQYCDEKGEVAWQKLMENVATLIAKPSDEGASAGACSAM